MRHARQKHRRKGGLLLALVLLALIVYACVSLLSLQERRREGELTPPGAGAAGG